MNHSIPIPVPNPDNQGFWDGCRRHELRLQRCRSCAALRHPPRPMCPQCTSVEYEWAQASGRGSVYTFTVVHGPTLPVFQQRAPYNVAVVQLDEGPFIVSNIVGCAADQIRIGMVVEVEFEDITETISLPRFRPGPPLLPRRLSGSLRADCQDTCAGALKAAAPFGVSRP